jgi:hypothetical protein
MYVAQFSSARSTRVIESFEPVNYRWEDERVASSGKASDRLPHI